MSAGLAAGARAEGQVSGSKPVAVNRADLAVRYELTEPAARVVAAELWVTRDGGQTWRLHGRYEPAADRLPFHALEEGVWGFYVVVVGADGAGRARRPVPGTPPMCEVLIDRTPPILVLDEIRRVGEGEGETWQARWSAFDSHLPERPVSIEYRVGEGPWRTLGGSVANTGVFEWRLPEGVEGAVTVRVRVRDEAGNATERRYTPIVVGARPAGPASDGADGSAGATVLVRERGAGEAPGADSKGSPSASALQAARPASEAALRAARAALERGEYVLAEQRLASLLAEDAENAEALVLLGTVRYRQARFESAADAFGRALAVAPENVEALRGRAMALVAQHRYGEAMDDLKRVTSLAPRDAQGYVDLGDVALMLGLEQFAHEQWRRAAALAKPGDPVAEAARRRLAAFAPAPVSRR